MDVFATVIGGVLVFVFGQWVQRFVLEPIATLHEEVAHLSYTLLLHQAAITNVNANVEIQNELKQLGASIVSEAGRIPVLGLFESTKNIQIAIAQGYSNWREGAKWNHSRAEKGSKKG